MQLRASPRQSPLVSDVAVVSTVPVPWQAGTVTGDERHAFPQKRQNSFFTLKSIKKVSFFTKHLIFATKVPIIIAITFLWSIASRTPQPLLIMKKTAVSRALAVSTGAIAGLLGITAIYVGGSTSVAAVVCAGVAGVSGLIAYLTDNQDEISWSRYGTRYEEVIVDTDLEWETRCIGPAE